MGTFFYNFFFFKLDNLFASFSIIGFFFFFIPFLSTPYQNPWNSPDFGFFISFLVFFLSFFFYLS